MSSVSDPVAIPSTTPSGAPADAYTIEPAVATDLDGVRRLMRRYAAGIPVDLAYQHFDAELAALPAPYVAPHGGLRVVREAGRLVGIGAFRPIGVDVAEIKRLYLLPETQGRGLGRRLLQTLLDDARAAGHRRVRLDSHRASMHAAIGLYRALGFVEIPPYGPDLDGQIVFFEARL